MGGDPEGRSARPQPDRPVYRPPVPAAAPRPTLPTGLPAGTRIRTVNSAGVIRVDDVSYKIDVAHAFGHVLVVADGDQPGDTIIVTDLDGEILAERTRPAPGIGYVGNGRPRGRRPNTPRASPKS